jgi:hypothetical protein
LAAVGEAIARANRDVLESRNRDEGGFFSLGFDIATGIYGDRALGAQGVTVHVPGPGQTRIRESLNDEAKLGFDTSKKLHLGPPPLKRRKGEGKGGMRSMNIARSFGSTASRVWRLERVAPWRMWIGGVMPACGRGWQIRGAGCRPARSKTPRSGDYPAFPDRAVAPEMAVRCSAELAGPHIARREKTTSAASPSESKARSAAAD